MDVLRDRDARTQRDGTSNNGSVLPHSGIPGVHARRPVTAALTALAAVLILLTPVSRAAAEQTENFIRVSKDERGLLHSMDTAIATYDIPAKKGKHGAATVDLVAVVHVGEKDYYSGLNQRFDGYDAVLYELIAPESSPLPPPRIPGGPPGEQSLLSQLQGGIRDLLGLEFQLDGINYHRPNMVHADLSPESFLSSMKERGETFWTIAARLILQGIADQQANKDPAKDLKLLAVLLKGTEQERQVEFRRYLAQNFSELDAFIERLEGPKGSTIIAARNQKALQTLDTQLGKGKKRLAIFYGAAHMPDMERRLVADFAAAPKRVEWLKAWSLTYPPPADATASASAK